MYDATSPSAGEGIQGTSSCAGMRRKEASGQCPQETQGAGGTSE